MRSLWVVGFAVSLLVFRTGHANTTNNELFANAALREIHGLDRAAAKLGQATTDSDNLGCQYANEAIEQAAHKALESLHYMSITPSDAIRSVSTLLRLNHLNPRDTCPSDSDMNLQWITAGQAAMALRWDYATGEDDWYSVEANGIVGSRNPLTYSESLRAQDYSWVSLRPKGMVIVVEQDWGSEIASNQVDDPSIKNSGMTLEAVEVDYRKNSKDEATDVYFYRTREGATVAAQEARKQADEDAKSGADQEAADAEWTQKLLALPYVVANRDIGFKLIYSVCRFVKSATGQYDCNSDDPHDWSDDYGIAYRWFGDIQECEAAQIGIVAEHPADIKLDPDDAFISDCVPAPKSDGHVLKGYSIVIAMAAQGESLTRGSFANLRGGASEAATVFKAFDECFAKIGPLYQRFAKDLNVDKDGHSLIDTSKSIGLSANCVRIYWSQLRRTPAARDAMRYKMRVKHAFDTASAKRPPLTNLLATRNAEATTDN